MKLGKQLPYGNKLVIKHPELANRCYSFAMANLFNNDNFLPHGYSGDTTIFRENEILKKLNCNFHISPQYYNGIADSEIDSFDVLLDLLKKFEKSTDQSDALDTIDYDIFIPFLIGTETRNDSFHRSFVMAQNSRVNNEKEYNYYYCDSLNSNVLIYNKEELISMLATRFRRIVDISNITLNETDEMLVFITKESVSHLV